MYSMLQFHFTVNFFVFCPKLNLALQYQHHGQ